MGRVGVGHLNTHHRLHDLLFFCVRFRNQKNKCELVHRCELNTFLCISTQG